jgi:hypothetical protein
MAVTTYRSPAYSQNSTVSESSQTKWDSKYIIDNLPQWIYSDNEEPKSVTDCHAKISCLEYTLKDIDLQIEIRQLELQTGNSRHQSTFDFDKWRTGALKAKQTHLQLLNAYKYWLIKNTPDEVDVSSMLGKLVELLIEDPADFELKARSLLQSF